MRKQHSVGTISLVGLFELLLIIFSFPGHSAAQTSTAAESCVNTKCHVTMGKDKVVHNPVKEGMCTTCHQAADDPQKKTKHPGNLVISLVQPIADLCAMCHEPKNKKKVVHAPVQGGDCTSCHNPHQSPNKGMLKDSMPNICFQCHPDKEAGLKIKKVVHYPVKQSCIQCHDPHGSSSKAMLSAPVPELCSNCHPNQVKLRQRAATKHGPMADQKSCRNCHDPHFSDQPRLLVTTQMALCLACHDKERETGKGTIMNMKAFLKANKNTHGPLKSNDCVSCHNPHGSDYWRILVKYYPPDFYASYSEGQYALCFTCHDKTAFTERVTKTSTGFRDGEQNLHFVHVNKISKGRTCKTCHEVHADSGQQAHVKQFVGFSGWAMPMNFTQGKNGGTCAPGCHGEKRYNR